ncbi:MAG: hypothetical protein IKG42_04980 [Clostridia bacterium]|nr:hypothetical protein [Clostridia bacterium]
MQEIISYLKEYWTQIFFTAGIIIAMYKFSQAMFEAVKCSLRNDILEIYDRCKEKKQITKYQLESIEYSYKLYKSLKGNSFVDAIYDKVKKFELID